MHRHGPSLVLLCAIAGAAAPGQQQTAANDRIRLLYERPARALVLAAAARPGTTADAVVDEVVACLARRLREQATIARRGSNQFTVDVRADVDAAMLRRSIETTGRFEIRMVATDADFDAKGQKLYDLAQERQRLQDWLDHGGRELLLQDPRAIDRFLDDPKAGPVAGQNLCWFVHVIQPIGMPPQRWGHAFAAHGGELAAASVMASDPADFAGKTIPAHVLARPRALQRLVELVAINMHEAHFGNRDLQAEGTCAAVDEGGLPYVRYQLRPHRVNDYGGWTDQHRGHLVAMLLDGVVLCSQPLQQRSLGSGAIEGPFTREEARAMAAALKATPLPVTPVFLKQEPGDRR